MSAVSRMAGAMREGLLRFVRRGARAKEADRAAGGAPSPDLPALRLLRLQHDPQRSASMRASG